MFDVVILGGGLTGLTTAIALSKHNIKVAIIEKNNIKDIAKSERTITLSQGSIDFYKTIGVDFNLENVDPNKINVSAWHWGGSEICDDNLYVSNSDLYRKIHYDAFDNLIEDAVKLGRIYFQEKNFTRMIDRKGLYDLVVKQPDLKFDLLRENKLWY